VKNKYKKNYPVKLFFISASREFNGVKKAFSLIELVVVIAIIAIMTAVLFLSVDNKSKAKNEVETATQQLISQIRFLQNETLSGKLIGSDPVSYFKFSSSANSAFYTVGYYKASDLINSLGTKNINFNNKGTVLFSAFVGTAGSFYFKAPVATLFNNNLTGITTHVQIKVKSKTDASFVDSVCICASGNIIENKSTTSCSDATLCGA
jgi:prepilin-type N-terminal cleavage/methylation domain-containing protein